MRRNECISFHWLMCVCQSLNSVDAELSIKIILTPDIISLPSLSNVSPGTIIKSVKSFLTAHQHIIGYFYFFKQLHSINWDKFLTITW